jgi:predicted site-specific integrase-resolvase
MKTYNPTEYAEQVWNNKVSGKTIRNWINAGRMPANTTVEQTPTGRYLINVEDKPKTEVQNLLEMMQAKAS